MARALATHDRLISTVVVDHGGRLVRPRVRATAPRVSSTARRRRSSPPWSCNGPLPPSPGHYRRRWRWIAIRCGTVQEREADFSGRIALGRRFGPGMTPSQGDTEDRGPPGDGNRLPSRNESLSTPLGVLQVCPTCSPDRCSRRCGLIRTARPSRSDRERSRVATCSRWCAGWPPGCATPAWARAKASDAAGNAEVAAGSAQQHGVDPVSAALLAIDGVVALALVVLLLRQPPPQPSRPPS